MGMKKIAKKFVKVYHAEPPNYPEIVNGKWIFENMRIRIF